MFKKIKQHIFSFLGLCDYPVVIVYNGFGNENTVNIMGHVLDLSPHPRKNFNSGWVRNFFSVVRLFMVSPMEKVVVSMDWKDHTFKATTEKDGFFKFGFQPESPMEPGWHDVVITLWINEQKTTISGHGSVFIPHPTQVAFVSDIDDTFLVSHTAHLRKRLFELLTHNGHSRKVFDGVINHYQLLAGSGVGSGVQNPFFYVSSSEWNLYQFLVEFTKFNDLPKGVFLLGQLKKLKDFWKSGQNNHATKFMRIVRIIEMYPDQKFVLLGDDSQQDPIIYNSLTDHFPGRILAVYLRKVYAKNLENVTNIVSEMAAKGIECCYFEHSSEAVIHSKKIGLILE